MRSAEQRVRRLPPALLAAACIVLSGCSSIGLAPKTQPASEVLASSRPASATPAASVPAPQANPPATAPAPVAPAEVPAAAQRTFDTARRALAAGRADEAERGFRSLVQSNPELGGPHANLGLLYRQAGRLPEAVAELEAAVRANPQQAAYENELGVAYRMQGQFQKARAAYEKAIALDAAFAAPVLNLGILYDLYLWEPARALELYERYLAMSPAGDERVRKWVADIRNRTQQRNKVSSKEQP